MAELRNSRHELFPQHYAAGLGASEAFRRTVGPNGPGYKDADVQADKWMKRPGVRGRVEELQKAQSDKCEISRDEFRAYLISVMRTPCGQIHQDHPLCQSVRSWTGKDGAATTMVSMPDKLKAAEMLGKMCGWMENKLTLDTGDTLTAFLQGIREGGGRRVADDGDEWKRGGLNGN